MCGVLEYMVNKHNTTSTLGRDADAGVNAYAGACEDDEHVCFKQN